MKILFICDGNVARSQEAELYFNLFRTNSQDKALSAGVDVTIGKPIDPKVVEVMAEEAIAMDTAYRKRLTKTTIDEADMVVSFKEASGLPDYARTHKDIRYWPVQDPRQQDIEFHRRIRDDIKRRVISLVRELTS